jgi:hypothetical protein
VEIQLVCCGGSLLGEAGSKRTETFDDRILILVPTNYMEFRLNMDKIGRLVLKSKACLTVIDVSK